MLTIGTLLSNISKGQYGVPTKMIFQQLNMVYDKLKPNIRILKAEMVNNGTQIYLYVPSENNERLYYDVDIWFNSKTTIATTTPFKIYSNSPAFGYSYVYIFNQIQKSGFYGVLVNFSRARATYIPWCFHSTVRTDIQFLPTVTNQQA